MRAKLASRDSARRAVGVLGAGEADARLQRQRYAQDLQQQVEAKKVPGSFVCVTEVGVGGVGVVAGKC